VAVMKSLLCLFFFLVFFLSLESVLFSRFIAQCAITCSLSCPCKIAMNSSYRILRNKRLPPNKRPPFLFVIANIIELKGKFEVFRRINAKLYKKRGLFQFLF